MLIKNGCIVLEDRIFKGDLRIKDGVIAEIGVDLCSDSDTVLDADGRYVCPGFVDIHTHGGYGSDFMESNREAFTSALRFHTDSGTTTVVPTSCTAGKNDLVNFLKYSQEYMSDPERDIARVPGVHLEGPYLSVRNKGAQNPDFLAVLLCRQNCSLDIQKKASRNRKIR